MFKDFIKKHERKLSAGALLIGFTWDTITLTRIDYLFEVFVFGTHTSLIILWIFLINLVDGKALTAKAFQWLRSIAPILMQVSFGALFSGLTIFYVKSASLTTSIVFVVVLVALLIGNEFFKQKYQRFVFQFSVLYVALASFLALYLPVIFGSIAPWVFMLATITAAILIYLLVRTLRFFVRERVQKSETALRISVISLLALLQILYFTNIIPPVPLALKEKGVYHSVQRSGNTFFAQKEEQSFLEEVLPGTTLHYTPGSSIAVYTAVFAPTGLETEIAHKWQFFDEANQTWVDRGTIPFVITGGRDEGFRGYTQKSALTEGRWRVEVQTGRAQVLGRVGFTLISTQESVETTTVEL